MVIAEWSNSLFSHLIFHDSSLALVRGDMGSLWVFFGLVFFLNLFVFLIVSISSLQILGCEVKLFFYFCGCNEIFLLAGKFSFGISTPILEQKSWISLFKLLLFWKHHHTLELFFFFFWYMTFANCFSMCMPKKIRGISTIKLCDSLSSVLKCDLQFPFV